MSHLRDYINRQLTAKQLEDELQILLQDYETKTGSYLFVYAASFTKNIPDAALNRDDFFVIYDMLREVPRKNIDFYIETPGGSGETAEEIAKFLHQKFDHVNFIISGEAKSAGTLLVLSGNEISMTNSGSLGPVDAQVPIGRGVVSASDYMDWIQERREEAEIKRTLNPFDAVMIAQISPGEYYGVDHALNYAKDLIKEWLPLYKFKNWTTTKTQQIPVDDNHKKRRAEEIATWLADHKFWRSHGRSLKINDLIQKLMINCIDEDPPLADLIYRIQTVIKLIFHSSTAYKIYSSKDEKILRNAVPTNIGSRQPTIRDVNVVEFNVACPQCGKSNLLYGKFVNDAKIDKNFSKKGAKCINGANIITCSCGFNIDILPFKNDIEKKTGKKFI